MRRTLLSTFLAVGLVDLVLIVGADVRHPAAGEPAIIVSAAVSLTDVLQEIEKAYKAGGGGPVRFNFAASNVLARQIVNGAPADVFISADTVQMDYAQSAGAIDVSTRRDLLSNRLVIVTPRGRRAQVPGPRSLLDDRIRRIAIGDPAAVPVGTYGRAYLERAGIWGLIQPKLVPLASARAVLGAVESGGVDVAIVYESDAHASREVEIAFTVGDREGPPIVYPMAIVARSRNRAVAERFVAFVRGNEAREIFRRFRFGVSVITH